ncbi:NADH-quinone oxidoreductase subunit NuoE [Candidatus Finniella inopinata]|uniref:NADH-quinone oxidoreductase subunit NuoE n=1 Tax=Candidatus Finniella inopinata TaxID=1696036 RepID=A0A4Q7DNJ3_9PROT|nr:NADH-quinone oxidoreductase subunit NuoE [Candidatus Finniella inopinata]RZI46456.1 NADH-quinone oxidoreductase subunit NuoE [Candidatus Finniella inopinata]
MTTLKVDAPFCFNVENQEKADVCLSQYPAAHKQSALVPLLDLAQNQCGGWLPQPAIEAVGALVGIPFLKALEVASFYSMFHLKPIGNYHVQICGTTPCWLSGSDDLHQICKKHLGIDNGEITPDGKFTLSEIECLGACVNAPVVQINEVRYENITPYRLIEILKKLETENTNAGSKEC